MSSTTAPPSDTTEQSTGSTLADRASTPTTSQQQQLLDDIRTIVQEALVAHQDAHGRARGSSASASLVALAPPPPPPHVIVTCAEDRLAFGRFALLQMDYEVCMTIHSIIHDIVILIGLFGRPHSTSSLTSSWRPWTDSRSRHGCSPRFGINTV